MFIDIIATVIESGMLPFLMKKDQAPVAIQNTFLSCGVYFLAVRILTVNQLSPSVKLLLLLGLDTALGYAFFKNRPGRAFIFGILHFICIYTGEMTLQVLLLFFFPSSLPELEQHLILFIAAVGFSKILSIFLSIIFQRVFGKMEINYHPSLFFCVTLPLLLILGIMSKMQEYIFHPHGLSAAPVMALFSIGLLLSMLCLLYIYQYYFQLKELQLTRRLTDEQMLAVYNLYQDRMEQEKYNRRIYHDIQAHIDTLRHMRTAAKYSYAGTLLKQLENMTFYHYTGNETVDIVLAQKMPVCKTQGIQIVCIGDFQSLDFMNPMDIVTIFHNALDNAIHEYRKPDISRRMIEIKVWKFHDFMNLRFINACTEDEQGIQPSELHGFGLDNICRTAAKYDGEVYPVHEADRYTLRIVLPILTKTTALDA